MKTHKRKAVFASLVFALLAAASVVRAAGTGDDVRPEARVSHQFIAGAYF